MSLSKLFILFFLISITAAFPQTLRLRELKSINFEGNSNIPDHQLQSVIFSKESPGAISKFLFELSPSLGNPPVYFDSLLVEKDIKNLISYYKSEGFFKVKIKDKIKRTEETVELTFVISEGPRSRFGKINKIGFEKIPEPLKPQVDDVFKIDSTMYFSANIIREITSNVLSILQDNGFYSAQFAKTKALIDTTRNTVDVTFNLNLGERYKISEVSVEKNETEYSYVDENLIKEIVDIHKNEWFNKSKISEAEARLYRTDLFSSSMIQIGKIDSSQLAIPLKVKASVKPRNDIAPEIIANNEDNVFNFGFSLGYTRRNFLGGARKLNLQASATLQDPVSFFSNLGSIDSSFYGYGDLRLGIEQPFLFGKPIYTKLETYYTLQNRRNEYYSQIYGVRLTMDFSLPKYVFFNGLTAFVRAENSTYHYKEDYVYGLFENYINATLPPGEREDALDSLKNTDLSNFQSSGQNFYIGGDGVRNTTNDFRFPTKGYSLSLHLEDGNNLLALLKKLFNSDFERPQYAKTIVNFVYYLQKFSTYTSTLGFKIKVGAIHLFKGNREEIPLDERLYAGGSNSVRGWRNRELVPTNSRLNIDASKPTDLEAILLQNFTPGGFALLEGSLEYRKKLIGDFGGTVFADYGNTWLDFNDFRWDDIAVAIGFGLRYYTDFFPIRFDFGFKFYDPYDKRSFFKKSIFRETFNFHLGIGEAF